MENRRIYPWRYQKSSSTNMKWNKIKIKEKRRQSDTRNFLHFFRIRKMGKHEFLSIFQYHTVPTSLAPLFLPFFIFHLKSEDSWYIPKLYQPFRLFPHSHYFFLQPTTTSTGSYSESGSDSSKPNTFSFSILSLFRGNYNKYSKKNL